MFNIPNHSGQIIVLAPKLHNFPSVGFFPITFGVSQLKNVNIKLRGSIPLAPSQKWKKYYRQVTHLFQGLGSARILILDLETVEALSDVSDYFVRFSSPFYNLKYVKVPEEYKESSMPPCLKSYLLGGSPKATIVTTLTQNTCSNTVPAETAQNVVIQEPLAAPTMAYFDSGNVHKNVFIDTVDIWVQEQDVDVVENSEVQAHKVRQLVDPLGGTTCNDRPSSSKEISDFGIWRGLEVKSEFVCLLDLIMNKYPETFEHCTTKIKKFCTMELNKLCTSINDFTKMSMAKVDIEVIAEYRAVFAELQKYGFGVSWLENRLNYVEQLRFSHPLIPELGAIDCQIDDTKIKLQDLENKLQDLKTVRAEKLQEIQNVFGTMGANLAAGYIGDDLFSV
ncbi:hypothetical protein POM88_033261 [Heracleum sosnowskyi]|uniref:Uncharacterized protein n=1 Tax=Heracleum sosnowskyi TaxID=360622 RepID=A0AAD8I378_9APIA|nr:hypothetical protein POM88_033261 [Heracleum sosnowskyi]